jgi:hypothetical protein
MFFPRRCRAAELRDGLVVCSWPDRLRRRLRLWLRLLRHLPLTHRPYPGRAHFGREHCNLAACAAQLVLDCNELGLRSGPVVQRASLHAVLDASLLPHRDSPRRGRCCRRRRRPRRAPSPQATPCGGRLGVLGRREHDAATRLGVRAPRSAAGCLLARTCQPASSCSFAWVRIFGNQILPCFEAAPQQVDDLQLDGLGWAQGMLSLRCGPLLSFRATVPRVARVVTLLLRLRSAPTLWNSLCGSAHLQRNATTAPTMWSGYSASLPILATWWEAWTLTIAKTLARPTTARRAPLHGSADLLPCGVLRGCAGVCLPGHKLRRLHRLHTDAGRYFRRHGCVLS